MNNLPAAKLTMMQGSIRCLRLGLLSLLPVIGLPFAVSALVLSAKVRQQEKVLWNVAKPYRVIGILCAALGTVAWLLIGGLIMLNATNGSGDC